MEPLEKLREKIAGFPGYNGDLERRRSDEYVRSYMGEALTEFAARNALSPQLQSRIGDLLLRVAFADPREFGEHHIAVATSQDDGGAVAAADAATVELADRAASLRPEDAANYLDDVEKLLDERDAAMSAAAKTT
jgi:class 3 adenylate cyclase